MKRTILRCLAIIPIMAAATLSTSCIYDEPDDRFYRTLWTSEEEPLGKITLEFLCGNQISVLSPDAAGAFGTYESNGSQAWFEGLTLTYDGLLVTLLSARRNGDTLILTWSSDLSTAPSTTSMHRLSAYE